MLERSFLIDNSERGGLLNHLMVADGSTNIYMGGLALMVFHQKIVFFALLNVHIGDYSTTFEVF